ncbi:hypothetical protein O6H91_01G129300 [Diphasiastrum complanatum]|uniref:Uncharacterized protein n=1 Tax=Diphasiastrum complanatum TaxID=34168 RepID=A0ACC2EVZ0_DIPCM|nr:hypothetical protein O6H91_01G129300 [Diphasiastrum complanatum]
MAKQGFEEDESEARDAEKALEKEGWRLSPDAPYTILQNLPQETRSGGNRRGHPLEQRLRETALDLDLKDIGARCIPEAQALRQMHCLRGALVLQIASIANICESKATSASRSKNRLLRMQLSDGHTSVPAIEYHHIPSLSLDIPPGTKVRISDAAVHSGVLFLEENVVCVLGGHVQTLYDAWEIEHRYSGLARATMKGSLPEGGAGPPPFRGLSVSSLDNASNGPHKVSKLEEKSTETHSNIGSQHIRADITNQSGSSHYNQKPIALKVRPGSEPYRPRMSHDIVKDQDVADGKGQVKESHLKSSHKMCSSSQSIDGGPRVTENRAELSSTSQVIRVVDPTVLKNAQSDAAEGKSSKRYLEERIDVVESVRAQNTENLPVQNRMAAQKLLERKIQIDPCFGGRGENRGRGRRGGRRAGKERMEDQTVFTLDEWEARQRAASASLDTAAYSRGQSIELSDEALARKLQQELDLESDQATESEQLRLSMFKFPSEQIENSSRERIRGRRGGRRQRF